MRNHAGMGGQMAKNNTIEQEIENKLKELKSNSLLPEFSAIDCNFAAEALTREKIVKCCKDLMDIKKYFENKKIEPEAELLLLIDACINFLSPLRSFGYTITKTYENIEKAARILTKTEKKVLYYTYIEQLYVNDILEKMNIKRATYNTHLKSINSKFEMHDDYGKDSLCSLFEDRPKALSNEMIWYILN